MKRNIHRIDFEATVRSRILSLAGVSCLICSSVFVAGPVHAFFRVALVYRQQQRCDRSCGGARFVLANPVNSNDGNISTLRLLMMGSFMLRLSMICISMI